MSKLKFLCWLLVLALLAGGAAAVAWRAGLFGKRYTATAQVLVERLNPRILSQPAEKDDTAEFECFRETQMQLIKSRFVLTAALRDPRAKNQPGIERADARHDAIEWLGRQICVECPNPRTGILTVSLTSSDPGEAAGLVNAVVEAYMNEVVNDDRQRRRNRLSELQQISAEKENELRRKKEELKRLLENLGAGDDETTKARVGLAMNVYAEFLREFQKMRSEHRRLVGKLTEAKRTLVDLPNAEIPAAEVAALLYNNPLYRDLQGRLTILEAANKLNAEAVKPGANPPPELARTKADYDKTKAQLDDLERTSYDQIRGSKRIALEQEIRHTENQVAISTEQMYAFEKEVERKANEADSVGHTSVSAQMARAEVESVERILRAVTEEREVLRVELKAGSRVRVLGDRNSPAAIPECPDGWNAF